MPPKGQHQWKDSDLFHYIITLFNFFLLWLYQNVQFLFLRKDYNVIQYLTNKITNQSINMHIDSHQTIVVLVLYSALIPLL